MISNYNISICEFIELLDGAPNKIDFFKTKNAKLTDEFESLNNHNYYTTLNQF